MNLIVIFLYLIAFASIPNNAEVFSSSVAIRRLMTQVDHLRHDIDIYFDRKRSEMYRLLDDVILYRTPKYKDFTAHPINALKLIRVLHTLYSQIDDPDVSKEDFQYNWPQDNDLKGAYTALIRLQKTYKLSSTDMQRGIIKGVESEFSLDQIDMVNLAQIACDSDFLATCSSWIKELEKIPSQGISLNTNEALVHLYIKVKRYAEALDLISHLKPMSNQIFHEEKAFLKNMTSDENLISHNTLADKLFKFPYYEELCRGENVRKVYVNPEMSCLYRNLYLPYYQYKEEVYNAGPRVSVILDVVNESEIQHLKTKASSRFKRARVGTVKPVNADFRITQTAWLDDQQSPVVSTVSKRISALTGLSVGQISNDAEHLQVANYGIGGQYEPHLDNANVTCEPGSKLYECIYGYRVATFMLYLDDVTAGGATVFPRLNLQLKPVKYGAAFWYNVKPSGEIDELTLHAGCPVIHGEKWVANKWILSNAQMLKRPCGLSPDVTDPVLPMD